MIRSPALITESSEFDSMKYGHVKISRKAYATDQLWLEPRIFSRWEALEWFIQAAAWQPVTRTIKLGGKAIDVELERGELVASSRYLSEAFQWGHSKTRLFLAHLQKRGTLEVRRETQAGTVYFLVKYSSYQGDGEADDTAKAGRTTQRRHSKQHSKQHKVKAVISSIKSSKLINGADAPTDGPTDVDNFVENSVTAIIGRANAGILENPMLDKTPLISVRHRSRKAVVEWIRTGAAVADLEEIVYQVAKSYRPDGVYNRISTMDYFSAAVAEELERIQSTGVIPVDRKKKRSDLEEWRDANPQDFAAIEREVERWIEEHPTHSRGSDGVKRTIKEAEVSAAVRRRINAAVKEATA